MDGFEANEGIIIVAATNRPDVLDPALLRPGRFDRQVVVPRPDIEGRIKILEVHMKKVPLAPDVDARVIARGTPGFSGADLANLVNEAALMGARKGKRLVAMAEFEEAKDKVMMGAERRSMVMTEDEKRMTAYHEAGHAIVSIHETASDPIHKATIIQYATGLARDMVTKWGMSEKVGPVEYAQPEGESFLGYSSSQPVRMSNATAQLIDDEIKSIVEGGLGRAKQLLTDHIDQLHLLADALLEYETLSGEEIKKLIAGDDIGRRDVGSRSTPLPVAGTSIPKTRRPSGPFGNPAPAGA